MREGLDKELFKSLFASISVEMVLTKQLQEKAFSFLSECSYAMGHTLLLSLFSMLIAPMQ